MIWIRWVFWIILMPFALLFLAVGWLIVGLPCYIWTGEIEDGIIELSSTILAHPRKRAE